jgi:hypothetical protein
MSQTSVPSKEHIHTLIIRSFLNRGFPPSTRELAALTNSSEAAIRKALIQLQDAHGVVLHPTYTSSTSSAAGEEAQATTSSNSNEMALPSTRSPVWICHPFSSAPTGYIVRRQQQAKQHHATVDEQRASPPPPMAATASEQKAASSSTASSCDCWWGNCAWCSLGLAALVRGDAVTTITTMSGGDGEVVTVRVVNGELDAESAASGAVVHFPIKMAAAWDNVVYTCSVMQLFTRVEDVPVWCERHNIAMGDVVPLVKAFAFAKEWYGRHNDDDWTKWTMDEASAMFERHGLTHPVWQLPTSATNQRF